MPKVTVLLPVYNGEQYLYETIQSILSQSFSNFELLIVDDGSTDASAKIIHSFHDSRIRILVNSKRLRLSGALNRGFDEARGMYIARMDADDISLPLRLQKQVDFLDKHPKIGMCGTSIEIFGKKVKKRVDVYPENTDYINTYALFDCPFCHPSVMMRKTMFNKYELRYDGSYYPTEDYELWSRATVLFPTSNLKDILLQYRVHDASMTGADWSEMDKQATKIIGNLLNKFGVQFTDDELQMHRNIGRGRSCRVKSVDELDRVDIWLHKLISVNNKRNVYDKQALAETISFVWYRLCLNNTFLGMHTIRTYLSSSLSGIGLVTSKRIVIIFASTLKNCLLTKSVTIQRK